MLQNFPNANVPGVCNNQARERQLLNLRYAIYDLRALKEATFADIWRHLPTFADTLRRIVVWTVAF